MTEPDRRILSTSEQLRQLQVKGKFKNLRRPEMADPFACTDQELKYLAMFSADFRLGQVPTGGRQIPVAWSADGYSRAQEAEIYSRRR